MWLASHRTARGGGGDAPLPVLATITKPLVAVERSGQQVSTDSLKGKVWTVGYTYTRCPHGCLGVVADMISLRDEFGKNPDYFQVSVAVGPEIDTQEVLKSFAEASGIAAGDPWWFISGDKLGNGRFMTQQVGFEPTIETPFAERLNEFDLYTHDLRIALVDREGRVRGYYPVRTPDPATAALHLANLRRDIKRLLDAK